MLRLRQGFALNGDAQSDEAQKNHNFTNHFIRLNFYQS